MKIGARNIFSFKIWVWSNTFQSGGFYNWTLFKNAHNSFKKESPKSLWQESHERTSWWIPAAKNSLGCCLNYCTTPFSISLSDANLTLSVTAQQWQHHMVISTDVWAPPPAWHSVGAAPYGPHGNCQQHDAINQFTYCVQDQLNAMKWEVLKYQTYSPNLSPYVFRMFGLLKKPLMMDDAVGKAVIQCFRQQLKDFFRQDMLNLCSKIAPV